MARPKSPFTQSFGTAFEIWKSLSDAVMEVGGNDDSLRRIQSNAKLRRALAETIVGKKEELAPATPSRLTHVASHIIPATTVLLTCASNFARYLWGDFKATFIGKEEAAKPETTLYQYRLTKDSTVLEIITDLGGEAKAETTLAEIKHLMNQQVKGEAGVLLSNGRANLFFVRDKNGLLCLVRVHWDDDGWGVHACPLAYPPRWLADDQVFARN